MHTVSANKDTLQGCGVAGYRSFDDGGFVLRRIKEVNVFIGKNNSGKSNLLRAIDVLRTASCRRGSLKLDAHLDKHRHGQGPIVAIAVVPSAFVFHGVGSNALYESLVGPAVEIRWDVESNVLVEPYPLDALSIPQLCDLVTNAGDKRLQDTPTDKAPIYKELAPLLISRAATALSSYFERTLFVPVFRELRESKDGPGEGIFNGHNVVEKLREMQVPRVGKDHERLVFEAIQKLTAGLLGSTDLVLEVSSDNNLIVRMNGLRLPLDACGTGIHHLVILCAALAMHENTVFTIEEPEIHLHPDLQRKFLQFLSTTKNTYFVTSHSNVFLDSPENVGIWHVFYDGKVTSVEAVETTDRARKVLSDMGYKASDLVQSNGLVWVEGPSDRIYLNRWLTLVAPDLIEGIHYSIVFYGGKVLTHFSGQDDPVEDMVQVLRINRNAMFMLDRDGDSETANLNASKARIIQELGADSCWVTQGREVENYLPVELVNATLTNQYGEPVTANFDQTNDRVSEAVETALNAISRRTSYGKVTFAREFCDGMTADHLTVLDLKEWLEKVVRKIRDWNRSEIATRPVATSPPAP